MGFGVKIILTTICNESKFPLGANPGKGGGCGPYDCGVIDGSFIIIMIWVGV